MSHILVVDDHEQNRYMLQFAFQTEGHKVTLASNGAEALTRARLEPPDLIVSDILMPVMDGFTLCREWRADTKLQNIPFIFYTATYTDPKDEKLALDLGADRFVLKPQEPEVMIEIVREVIAAGVAGTLKVREPSTDEVVVMREYNEVLVRKLEKKLFDLEELNRRLEEEISVRKQAEEKIGLQLAELQRWQKVTLDREDRVIELKKEVNELLKQLGKPDKYESTERS